MQGWIQDVEQEVQMAKLIESIVGDQFLGSAWGFFTFEL